NVNARGAAHRVGGALERLCAIGLECLRAREGSVPHVYLLALLDERAREVRSEEARSEKCDHGGFSFALLHELAEEPLCLSQHGVVDELFFHPSRFTRHSPPSIARSRAHEERSEKKSPATTGRLASHCLGARITRAGR